MRARDGCEDCVRVGVDHDDAGAARVHRPGQTEVLFAGDDDLVVRPEAEPGEHDVAAVRRRARQRDVLRLDADERRESRAYVSSQLQKPVEVRLPHSAALQVCLQLLLHRIECWAGERPEGAGVEIRDVLEDREERARLGRGHPIVTSTGA